MREKLNSNPVAQIGLVVVLVIAAFVMLTKGGGGEEEEAAAPTEATVSVAGTEVSGTAVGATPGEAVESAVASAEASLGEAGVAIPSAAIQPPPLPADVDSAYRSDQTVVLLVVHDGGVDDRLVAESTERLSAFPDTAIFVVPAKQVYRYAAITLGLDVNRVPALVVMRPRSLSHGTPQASVTYGFQTSEGIEQAMRDATYDGPERTYHPD
ncbi:MAG TPA: hypothetical protein VHR18_08445 [Solirubrobacterales bacterium]|jgi:hypothetical protein|nr:hypothetical protein [Solirubrobacterales bacterium]